MKLLWLVWLFVVLPAILGQDGFGRAYLKNSRLCHQWTCINNKLGFPESLPLREESEIALRRVLPEGPWKDVVGNVLDNCYGNRSRRFTNICPGQALLHCVVDQMIDFCPESNLRKDDSCSPVSSLAGLKYMFSQSRYLDMEKNLPKEHRPSWFLKNYFDSKCCDLPAIFNTTVMQECGFSAFMNYADHGLKSSGVQVIPFQESTPAPTSTPAPMTPTPTTIASNEDTLKIVGLGQEPFNEETSNPLDCCDMTKFIQPSWRSECDFQLSWGGQDRLVISSQSAASEAPTTTTTQRTDVVKDVMLVPHTKNRREICLLPELIHHDHLSECGLQSLYRAEHVDVPPKPRKQGWHFSSFMCKVSKVPTTCMMNKMGVLKKYNFMDHFSMKNRILQFTTDQPEWAAFQEIYTSAFINTPMYQGHCTSERKLLNVIDAMLMTCPVSKRKNTAQCNKIFTDMTHTAPVDKQNVKKEKMEEIVFMPNQPTPKPTIGQVAVYPRSNIGQVPVRDGVLRTNPFCLHEQIAKAHLSTTSSSTNSPISTNSTVLPPTNNLYATSPVVPVNPILP